MRSFEKSLIITFTCLVMAMCQETSGTKYSLEQVGNIIQQFNETIEAEKLEKVKLQSTISNLQAELESFKNQSNANKEMNEKEMIEINRLDKMSRTGTSCSSIANLESGTFFLDTDGLKIAEAPYEAFCKMPERTTVVGNDFSSTFDRCDAQFCSEKQIQYSAPMPQLKLLLKKSPSCEQEVKFECQTAKIVDIQKTQNGFEEVSYLQWRDSNGNYNNFSSGENCDKNGPQMMSDTFKLTDRTLLPVTAVRYGPLRFELQQAKIFVSKLKCDPYDDPAIGDRLDDIDSKLEKLKTTTDDISNNADRLDDVDSKLEKLKTTQAGTIWFDASRTSMDGWTDGWITITYNDVKKSSTTGDGSPDGISTSTGIFICAIKGAYKFDFAAVKYYSKSGNIRLMQNGNVQNYMLNTDSSSHNIVSLIAILDLVPGDKVWMETHKKLYADGSGRRITFTGFLLEAKEN